MSYGGIFCDFITSALSFIVAITFYPEVFRLPNMLLATIFYDVDDSMTNDMIFVGHANVHFPHFRQSGCR